jgi:hypothetical protein
MTRLIRRIAALVILFGLSLIAVSGCRGSDSTEDIVTVPSVRSGESERSVAPDYGSVESTESKYGPNESHGSGNGSHESTAPDSSTDPCAFWDDPACPHTPIKVPPPDISNWP